MNRPDCYFHCCNSSEHAAGMQIMAKLDKF